MKRKTLLLYSVLNILIFLCEIKYSFSWTNEDLELFDLVEEVNKNFYEVLGVNQDATTGEIKKAYRRMSLLYHPDKNKEPGVEEKFRQIVSIAEVLKDEERRKTYDIILVQGLPDWKQPIFYYRRVKKMSLVELSVFLGVLFTLGHYIVAWSIYWERMYEIEEVIIAKFRKRERKSKKKKNAESSTPTATSLGLDHMLIPKPRYQDLLPIRLTCFLFYLIKSAPAYYQHWRETWLRKPIREEPPPLDPQQEMLKKPRKRLKPEIPDYTCIFQPVDSPSSESEENGDNGHGSMSELPSQKQEGWTEADTMALIKAMNKFPGGTANRWDKIAHCLNRTEAEVTRMAKQLKSSNFAAQVPSAIQGVTGSEEFASPSSDISSTVKDEWSQAQQKALEMAMKNFPKGHPDRWDQIAPCVPGKTKDECIQRYKHLVEMIRKKKTSIS